MRIRNVRVKVIYDLPPPFDEFKCGFVTARKNLKGRRNIRFKRKRRGVRYGVKLPRRTTYARFLLQAEYWKKYGTLIPEGYEVDHINNDRTDDRIENLQLLPKSEHMWKRDKEKYGHLKIKKSHIENIKQYLYLGMSWSQICNKTGLKPDLLRYILVFKIEGYTFELNAEMNLKDMKRMLKEKHSFKEIALHFGVSEGTIRRITKEHKLKR